MFDVTELTLDEIDAEFELTLNKLERLSKLREAVGAQDQRRIEKLITEFNAAKEKEKGVT